jgi:hypothetical protein
MGNDDFSFGSAFVRNWGTNLLLPPGRPDPVPGRHMGTCAWSAAVMSLQCEAPGSLE